MVEPEHELPLVARLVGAGQFKIGSAVLASSSHQEPPLGALPVRCDARRHLKMGPPVLDLLPHRQAGQIAGEAEAVEQHLEGGVRGWSAADILAHGMKQQFQPVVEAPGHAIGAAVVNRRLVARPADRCGRRSRDDRRPSRERRWWGAESGGRSIDRPRRKWRPLRAIPVGSIVPSILGGVVMRGMAKEGTLSGGIASMARAAPCKPRRSRAVVRNRDTDGVMEGMGTFPFWKLVAKVGERPDRPLRAAADDSRAAGYSSSR